MTFEDVRKELKKCLDEMAALKPFADAGNPAAEPFVAAFAVAHERALNAAKAYVEAAQTNAG
jgi:hypothetical protein